MHIHAHRLLFTFLVVSVSLLSSCASSRQNTTSLVESARPVSLPMETSNRPSEKPIENSKKADTTPPKQKSGAVELVDFEIDGGEVAHAAPTGNDQPADALIPLPLPTDAALSDPVLSDTASGSKLSRNATGLSSYGLSDAEASATARHPGLGGATAAVNKATGLWQQVGLKPNPVIGYQANEIGVDGSAGQQGLFWQQTIVRGDKLRLNREVEAWNVEQLKWNAETLRTRVLTDVRIQFYATLAAQKKQALAQELIAAANEGVSIAEQLVEAGEVPQADVLQARVQAAEIAILGDNAEADAISEWRKLAVLTGWSSHTPMPLVGELEASSGVLDFDSVYNDLLSRSPEIRAAETAVHAARKQIERQQHQATPNLEMQAGVAFDDSSNDTIANFQFGMPFPIHNDNRGNITAACANYQRACADLQRLRLSLRSRLAEAYRAYDRAERQVRRYRDDILPAASKSLELAVEGYQAGEYSILRTVQARQSFSQSQLNAIESQASYRIAESRLEGLLLSGSLDAIPDAGGDNLQGVGLRDQALGGQ